MTRARVKHAVQLPEVVRILLIGFLFTFAGVGLFLGLSHLVR